MDSHDTNDAVDQGLANARWLTTYKYYLTAAVAFTAVGLARSLVHYPNWSDGWVPYPFRSPVQGISQLGLFVFALWSLRSFGRKWVRTLHLSINGVAAIYVFFELFFASSLPGFTSIAVFPISGVIPYHPRWSLFGWATSITVSMFATYFFFRWLKTAPFLATDGRGTPPHAAGRPIDPWRTHRIWAGVLTVLLGLYLGILVLSFGQQTAFVSGVMSGVAPSAISIPLPVVAIILGIIIGGLMFCGERGQGRPMVWLAAVTIPPLMVVSIPIPVAKLVFLTIGIYVIWVLRNTRPTKEAG